MEDIDLDLIQERMKDLVDWQPELQDTRLSDAPYVTVIVLIPTIDAKAVMRLKAAFGHLRRMRIWLWQRIGVEVPLDAVDVAVLSQTAN